MLRDASILCGCLLVARAAYPCTIVVDGSHPRPTPQSLVREADAIVVATAVRTIRLADRSNGFPPLPPDAFDVDEFWNGTMEMRVDETIKGDAGGPALSLTGRLVDTDDFNRGAAPYTAARPGAQTGACFAYEYRTGASYLLFLRRSRAGTLTPYWAALQPVNEQLRGAADPWLLWVREQVAAK
jgi:hypothetical protein